MRFQHPYLLSRECCFAWIRLFTVSEFSFAFILFVTSFRADFSAFTAETFFLGLWFRLIFRIYFPRLNFLCLLRPCTGAHFIPSTLTLPGQSFHCSCLTLCIWLCSFPLHISETSLKAICTSEFPIEGFSVDLAFAGSPLFVLASLCQCSLLESQNLFDQRVWHLFSDVNIDLHNSPAHGFGKGFASSHMILG